MVKQIIDQVRLANIHDSKLKASKLKISLYNGNPYSYDISDTEIIYAENICIDIAKKIGIGTLAFYLFSIYIPQYSIWIPPCQNMIDYSKKYKEIYFRIRFLPSDIIQLLESDNIAFSYLFHQIRDDFLNCNIPNINSLKISECLGLAVTDILRLKQEDCLEQVIDYKGYIPTNAYNAPYNRLRLMISGNKAVKEALSNFEHQANEHNKLFYEEKYVNTLLKVPDYFVEKYDIFICGPSDNNEQKGTLFVEPYRDKKIYFKPGDSKAESIYLCNIRDLCFITLKSSLSIEISRKNGIPIFLKFRDSDTLFSLLSLLDGYYRLSEKFTFNLCTKCYSPQIIKLKSMNCHGPVNEEFVISKLEEKAKNKPGAFLIRQSENGFDSYILDVCLGPKQKPKSLFIINEDQKYRTLLENNHCNKLQDNENSSLTPSQTYSSKTDDKIQQRKIDTLNSQLKFWRFENSDEYFDSLKNLLMYYSKHSSLKFKQCLPPSDYEHSNLLICHQNLNNVLHGRKSKTSEVMCIPIQNLIFPTKLETILSNGDFGDTLLSDVEWEKDKVTRLPVSVKVVSTIGPLKEDSSRIFTNEPVPTVHGTHPVVTTKASTPDTLSSSNDGGVGHQADHSVCPRLLPAPDDPISKILKMMNAYAFLNDPTIIKTFGICLDPILIVTEPLPLGSLDRFLTANQTSVSPTELLEACSSISKALWYLEECKLPHGNLRCSNIYVHTRTPDKLGVKLSDPIITMEHSFYESRNKMAGGSDSGLVLQDKTFQAQRLPWLAPEHYDVHDCQRFKPTLASDVWAYGTTVWEIFHYGQQIPWDGQLVGQVKDKVLRGKRPGKPPNCPNDLYYLMNECWTRNRLMRKKIQELVRDVHQMYHQALNQETRRRLRSANAPAPHNYEFLTAPPGTPPGLTKHTDNFPDLRRALPPIPNSASDETVADLSSLDSLRPGSSGPDFILGYESSVNQASDSTTRELTSPVKTFDTDTTGEEVLGGDPSENFSSTKFTTFEPSTHASTNQRLKQCAINPSSPTISFNANSSSPIETATFATSYNDGPYDCSDNLGYLRRDEAQKISLEKFEGTDSDTSSIDDFISNLLAKPSVPVSHIDNICHKSPHIIRDDRFVSQNVETSFMAHKISEHNQTPKGQKGIGTKTIVGEPKMEYIRIMGPEDETVSETSPLSLGSENHQGDIFATKRLMQSHPTIPTIIPTRQRRLHYFHVRKLRRDGSHVTLDRPTPQNAPNMKSRLSAWASSRLDKFRQRLNLARNSDKNFEPLTHDSYSQKFKPLATDELSNHLKNPEPSWRPLLIPNGRLGTSVKNDSDPYLTNYTNGDSSYDDGADDSITKGDHWLIDDHEITYLKKLGEGNFGEVWLALWSPHGGLVEERVAVKRLKRYENTLESADLENEIEIMKRLHHPNIVEIKGICQNHIKQLVVEYLCNGSLDAYLKSCPETLSTQKKISYAIDISSGMEYLSRRGIVHRDLAARNVLVTDDTSTVKISDFGLSKMVSTGPKNLFPLDSSRDNGCGIGRDSYYADFLSSTRSDYAGYYAERTARKLPICWYAPETIDPLTASPKRFSQRTDVWSFGVTLWELFHTSDDYYPSKELYDVQENPGSDPVTVVLHAIMDDIKRSDPDAPDDYETFLSLLTPQAFVTRLHDLLANKGWRLPRPRDCPLEMYHIMTAKCWTTDHNCRPTFGRIRGELIRTLHFYEQKS